MKESGPEGGRAFLMTVVQEGHTHPNNFGLFQPSLTRVKILDAFAGVDGLTSDETKRHGCRRVYGLKLR